MTPPIFTLAAASVSVRALLGIDPVRVFPFGQAGDAPVLPYAVWQIAGGLPENYLAGRPDADSFKTQIDVYAASADVARAAAAALRDALELKAYVVSWRGETRDPVTRNYRFSFDMDWIVQR